MTETDREFDTGQFPAILGRRDLALVHRHAHTEEADSEPTDDAAKDHDPEPGRKGLEEAAEGEDARAGKDGGAAAKDVADAARQQGSDCFRVERAHMGRVVRDEERESERIRSVGGGGGSKVAGSFRLGHYNALKAPISRMATLRFNKGKVSVSTKSR